MPRIRYTGPIEELQVTPAGHEPINVRRLEWLDVPAEVAGKRPSGKDPGTGLLAQGEYPDGEFSPLWELESTKKARDSRAANEKE